MQIDIYSNKNYQIIKFEDDFSVISDLSELEYLIEGYIKQGRSYIAINFTSASYIYSGAIAVLINCFRKLHAGSGDLCIIEPNKDLAAIFDMLNLNRLINIYTSENDLPFRE